MKRKHKNTLLTAASILAIVSLLPSCTAIWLASLVAESCEEEIEQVGEAVLQVTDEETK